MDKTTHEVINTLFLILLERIEECENKIEELQKDVDYLISNDPPFFKD